MANEPAKAPICWGKQYEDGEDECNNCSFNDSCRPATMNFVTSRQTNGSNGFRFPSLPMAPPHFGQQPQRPVYPPQMPMLPQPSNYPRIMGPQAPGMPIPTHMMPPQPPQGPIAHQPHAPAGWNSPISYLPKPTVNGLWWQYAGEDTGSRLGKNILLGALQAIFGELLRFVTNWTWPQDPGNRRGSN